MILKKGATRFVFVFSKWVIKVPYLTQFDNFLLGLLANRQEKLWNGVSKKLCPVIFSFPLGFFLVMKRCELLSEWPHNDFYENFINEPGLLLPVEEKLDSFGILNGQIVAIDYGS